MIVVVFVPVVFVIPVMVLMIPVPFMPSPAFTIVIVVRMIPIRPFVGRKLPVPCHPPVVMPIRGPIPLDPDVARPWNRRTPLVTQRRRRASDVHGNLCRGRDGESDCEQYSAYPIQFHSGFSRMLGFRLRNPSGKLPPRLAPVYQLVWYPPPPWSPGIIELAGIFGLGL